jgi:uncharacterized protein (TIGR02594 family)
MIDRPTLRVGYGFPGSQPHLREDVRAMQRELERRGYRIGSADGYFGNVSEAAVKHFQRSLGIPDTGVVGPVEWTALLEGPVTNVGSSFVPPTTSRAEPAQLPDVPDSPEWLRIAKGEMWQREVAGQPANPRIVEYHGTTSLSAALAQSDETAWCSSFINWVFRQMGVVGTNNALAASWINWGTATTAQAGAITVIYSAAAANSSTTRSGNHCAFLVSETDTHYVLLGGNQGNAVQVKEFAKQTWELKAYRWPTGY